MWILGVLHPQVLSEQVLPNWTLHLLEVGSTSPARALPTRAARFFTFQMWETRSSTSTTSTSTASIAITTCAATKRPDLRQITTALYYQKEALNGRIEVLNIPPLLRNDGLLWLNEIASKENEPVKSLPLNNISITSQSPSTKLVIDTTDLNGVDATSQYMLSGLQLL